MDKHWSNVLRDMLYAAVGHFAEQHRLKLKLSSKTENIIEITDVSGLLWYTIQIHSAGSGPHYFVTVNEKVIDAGELKEQIEACLYEAEEDFYK